MIFNRKQPPRHSRSRKWLRWNRPKVSKPEPDGNYTFSIAGREHIFTGYYIEDAKSPDGRRWIATQESARRIRLLVCQLADNRCEMRGPGCWKWLPADRGHAHHVQHSQMGGGRRDDRIFVAGKKQRVWCCPSCHRNHHGEPMWSKVA